MKPRRAPRNPAPAAPPAEPRNHLLAVIELGSTSVRMVIAQPDRDGNLHTLASLQQPVTLGKDTFTTGRIGMETTEKCVEAIRCFDRKMKEFGLSGTSGQRRAVATSAVREAANRNAFLDRIYIATGLDVETLDEAEISRLTYLAVRPVIDGAAELRRAETLVIEVGGGSTELLQLRKGKVIQAHTFRLGALRLREMLEQARVPRDRAGDLLQSYVDRDVRQIVDVLEARHRPRLLALGGDARLAAEQVLEGRSGKPLDRISLQQFSELAGRLLNLSVDDAVRRLHISYPEAETLGPALLIYARFAEALGVRDLLIGQATLRDGILWSMTADRWWTTEFFSQITASALDIGRKYRSEETHATNVTAYARHLFHALAREHGLGTRHELILTVASLLHDIGLFVSTRSHHKHSMYLIQNSDIFGMGAHDQLMASLIARYHRKSPPSPTHVEFNTLDRDGRACVEKLAAILRVADALDRRHGGMRPLPDVVLQPGRMIIRFRGSGDLTLEKHALKAKGSFFREVYGLDVVLQATGRQGDHED